MGCALSSTSARRPGKAKAPPLLVPAEDNGRGRPLDRSVVDRLHVRPVRVEHEGGVVAGVVVALARRAVVAAAGGDRGLVEAIDRRAVGRLEREVETGRRRTVAR